jgi:hypothetical protein
MHLEQQQQIDKLASVRRAGQHVQRKPRTSGGQLPQGAALPETPAPRARLSDQRVVAAWRRPETVTVPMMPVPLT